MVQATAWQMSLVSVSACHLHGILGSCHMSLYVTCNGYMYMPFALYTGQLVYVTAWHSVNMVRIISMTKCYTVQLYVLLCSCIVQVDLKKVVEHVCDTAGHLLKPRVTLEKMVDQSTPLIAGDGSRIVQVCSPMLQIPWLHTPCCLPLCCLPLCCQPLCCLPLCCLPLGCLPFDASAAQERPKPFHPAPRLFLYEG